MSFTITDRGIAWVVHDLSELPRKPDQMGGRTFSHEARWSRFCSICNQGREAVCDEQ